MNHLFTLFFLQLTVTQLLALFSPKFIFMKCVIHITPWDSASYYENIRFMHNFYSVPLRPGVLLQGNSLLIVFNLSVSFLTTMKSATNDVLFYFNVDEVLLTPEGWGIKTRTVCPRSASGGPQQIYRVSIATLGHPLVAPLLHVKCKIKLNLLHWLNTASYLSVLTTEMTKIHRE